MPTEGTSEGALSLALAPPCLSCLEGCCQLLLLLLLLLPRLLAPPLVVGVVVPLAFLSAGLLALALALVLRFALVPLAGRAQASPPCLLGRSVVALACGLGACGRQEDGLLERGDVRHDAW